MVWITKREIAYYLILKHVFKDRIFNLGEAIDILLLFGTKHTARKIIKRLTSRGLLEKVDNLNYRVARDLEEVFSHNLKGYITQRMYKRLKSLGLSVSIDSKSCGEKVLIQNCNVDIKTYSDILKGIVDIECN